MSEGDGPVHKARQSLNTARECMAGDDVWSSGYEAGLAYGLLRLIVDDDPHVAHLGEELERAKLRTEDAEKRVRELRADLNDARTRANEAERKLSKLERENDEAFRHGRNFAISKIVNLDRFQESDVRYRDVGGALELSQSQVSRIAHRDWGPDDE